MKICVYGAGAIGGYLAGFLARGGHDVSVVARGAHLAAIRANGLTVDAPDDRINVRIAASDKPEDLGVQDAVVVTVKAPSLPDVAKNIAPLLGAHTSVTFLTNGIPWWYFQGHGGALDGRSLPLLDPDDALLRAVGAERLLGGIVWPASSVPEPGVIKIGAGIVRGSVVGTPDGKPSAQLDALVDAFKSSGLAISTSSNIRDLIWEKLAFNLSAGPMCVLTQAPVKATHEEEVCVDTSRRVMAEAMALIAAMGCHVSIDVEKVVAGNRALGHRPSILQDLQAGRKMEIDALYTTPLDMARTAGVPMPTLELLVALIKVRAREAGLYGR